jgi:5-methylcytosine-specific restriction endonuclease McrA
VWLHVKRQVRARARGRCESCGVELVGRGIVDHVVPLALGGSSTMTNLQLLCVQCDAVKTRNDLDAMRRHRENVRVRAPARR